MTLPERLGRLRRVDRIGAGGFATVWLYHDDELDSPVAVKALADNWASRDDICDRFLEEARILRRADSDHVVRVYDIGEVEGTPYFVMSYADRGSIADLVRPGQALAPKRVVDLIGQAGEGIAVLHRQGVIHRDIKPQNLLLRSTPDGGERVLVADLGVAKAMMHASGLTQVVGTPAYMAPEQAIGIGLDQRADIHALGAVGYHLLTGRLVRDVALGSLGTAPLPQAPSRVASVDPAFDPVLMRALAIDPVERWPDVLSFTAAMRAAGSAPVTEQVPRVSSSPATAAPHPPRADQSSSPLPASPHPASPPPSGSPSNPVSSQPWGSPASSPAAPSYVSETAMPEPRGAEGANRGGALRLVVVVLLVLLVAFGAAYGITRAFADGDPDGGSPGSGNPPGQGGSAGEDIDFPTLVAPTKYETHELRAGGQIWSYGAPADWVAYRVALDSADDTALAAGDVDTQGQVRWRPKDEPLAGGHSVRVKVLSGPETVSQKVENKVAAVEGSPDLKDVDVFEQTDDAMYFTYRDASDRLRHNYFRWVANEAGRASLEISVAGREEDQDGLTGLLDGVSRAAEPL